MVRWATVFLAKGMVLSLCVVLGVLVGTAVRELPAGASGGGAAQVMNGDVDGDGRRTLGDVIYMLRYIFQVPGAPEPVACADGAGLTPEQAEILGHMSIVQLDDGQGGTAKTIRVSGVNLQIVNGLGATNGNPDDPGSRDETNVNGLGNLILGYQESRGGGDDRTGSHNVVVGYEHNYSSFGGLVAGWHNTISNIHACVTGGARNIASGEWSSVSGGRVNTASGALASVSGGVENTASGERASVSGGWANTASGALASVSGGRNNKASGECSFVGGGGDEEVDYGNEAFGNYTAILGGTSNLAGDPDRLDHGLGTGASVSGGGENYASGHRASVSGGRNNKASGEYSFVGGGGGGEVAMGNEAFGAYTAILGGMYNLAGDPQRLDPGVGAAATVSGGARNIASGPWASVSGGRVNTASGILASVSGGELNSATGLRASVSGGEENIASGDRASVSGGARNTAAGHYTSVGGNCDITVSNECGFRP